MEKQRRKAGRKYLKKLTPLQRKNIRQRFIDGESVAELVKRYKVGRENIKRILKGVDSKGNQVGDEVPLYINNKNVEGAILVGRTRNNLSHGHKYLLNNCIPIKWNKRRIEKLIVAALSAYFLDENYFPMILNKKQSPPTAWGMFRKRIKLDDGRIMVLVSSRKVLAWLDSINALPFRIDSAEAALVTIRAIESTLDLSLKGK